MKTLQISSYFLAASLFLLSLAYGQSYREVTLRQLSSSPQSYTGQKVKVRVKLQSALSGIYEVYNSKIKFLIEDRYIRHQAKNRLSPGDNVKFWGVLSINGPNLQFLVKKFAKVESDEEYFEKKYNSYYSKSDYHSMKELGEEALQMAKNTSNLSLRARARQAFKSYLEIKEKVSPPPTFSSKFKLAKEYFTLAKERELALKKLSRLYGEYPDKAKQIAAFLQDSKGMNCIQAYIKKNGKIQKKWIPFESYKKLKGFLLYEGEWLTKEKVILRDFVRDYFKFKSSKYFKFKDVVPPSREFALTQNKIKGEIYNGMTKEEVVKSWGYPRRVIVTTKDEQLIEMWIFHRNEIWYDTLNSQAKTFPSKKFYLFIEKKLVVRLFSEKEIMEERRKK